MNKKSVHSTQSFYLEAKKTLGQNFLKDAHIIQKIAESVLAASEQSGSKLIHEIGPGSGAMTKPLLANGLSVTALEKDKRSLLGLAQTLQKEFPETLHLIETDILQFNPLSLTENLSQKPVCFGNIPYYITSDILFWLCQFKQYYSHGIFMVQNEVADRLQAKEKSKDYSRLTVKMQLNFEVKKLFVVPASCFVPKPKVDSAIIQLTPKEFSFPTKEMEKSFETFCAVLFSARRKMLRRVLHANLQEWSHGKQSEFWQQLKKHQIEDVTRPDAISPQQILNLYHLLQQYKTH